MSAISFKIFPAKSGDCFLINISRYNILIDGGYADTYRNHLKRELQSLSQKGECLDLIIVTHIDEDHISGIAEFLNDNGQVAAPNIIFVKDVWYNSYHLLPNVQNSDISLTEKETRLLQGYIDNYSPSSKNGNEDISARQGVTVAAQLIYGNYNVNYNSNACICTENNSVIDISDKTRIKVISPSSQQLEVLRKKWKSELNSKILTFNMAGNQLMDLAMESYFSSLRSLDVCVEPISESQCLSVMSIPELAKATAKSDTSETNASSIAFILETFDKKLLFLGDAHEEQIITELEKLQLSEDYVLFFDVIKISHHGSLKNTSKLFEVIDGRYFIFSTDGKMHSDHPSLATIAKIIIRPTENKRILIFNYENEAFNYYNSEGFMEKYNYEVLLSNLPDDLWL